MYTGNSGVVVEELPFRRQEFNFTLEYTMEGETVNLLQRDFRLGKQFYIMLTTITMYCRVSQVS